MVNVVRVNYPVRTARIIVVDQSMLAAANKKGPEQSGPQTPQHLVLDYNAVYTLTRLAKH
jgi:hypothetical protein